MARVIEVSKIKTLAEKFIEAGDVIPGAILTGMAFSDQLITAIPDLFMGDNRPEIICLCGSTKFKDQFEELNLLLTQRGKIVLSVGWFHHTQEGVVHTMTDEEKQYLDELHKRKIDLADSILVINVAGYIGESTASEIEYARSKNKRVDYLKLPTAEGAFIV